MKFKYYLFLLLSVVFLFANFAYGQRIIKYTTANLNLRTAPTTRSHVLTVIPRGTSVNMEECDCDWIAVEYNGYIGYVYAAYLNTNKPHSSYKRVSKSFYRHSKSKYRSYKRRYYTNSEGYRVQSPTYYNSRPAGATALCRDGTYSFSRSRRGTCSHHGGVAQWF